jgi:hypothetical protein
MGKMPCHISDGPQLPEDVCNFTDEIDPDWAYEMERQRKIDENECWTCHAPAVKDGYCEVCLNNAHWPRTEEQHD